MSQAAASPGRIVVTLPNWVGDCVMATPALRAIRQTYPSAHITYVLKSYVAGVVRGSPWHNDLIEMGGRSPDGGRNGLISAVRRLRVGSYDLGVLMNNSFRSALMLRVGNVRRRVGYDRDCRGLLLTDRLLAYEENGRFLPTPFLRYCLGISEYLGSRRPDPRPQLFITPQERAEAAALLARNGLKPDRPYVVLNPGAAFGSAKMWGAENFAAVSDEFSRRGEYQVVVLSGPRESSVGHIIHDASRRREGVVNLKDEVTDLGAIKAVVAGGAMLITNDSGPRHFGIAFDLPVVTIFGSTDPAWTECDHPKEIQLRGHVHCSPCALRTCPIDHRCMKRITPQMVMEAADILFERHRNDRRAAV